MEEAQGLEDHLPAKPQSTPPPCANFERKNKIWLVFCLDLPPCLARTTPPAREPDVVNSSSIPNCGIYAHQI